MRRIPCVSRVARGKILYFRAGHEVRMLGLMVAGAMAEGSRSLPIYQTYEIDGVVNQHKGRDVYLLVLYKLPDNVLDVFEAFSRFINAIPLKLAEPHLAISVNPTSRYNFIYHWSRHGESSKVRVSFHEMMENYALYAHDINGEIRERLKLIVDVARHQPLQPSRQVQHYIDEGVQHNMNAAVDELANVKLAERAALVRDAYNLQEQLDANLSSFEGRGPLPSFAAVDPRRLLRNVDRVRLYHKPLYGSGGLPIDEDAADYDDGNDRGELKLAAGALAGDDVGWWGRLLRFVGVAGDDEVEEVPEQVTRPLRRHVNFDERLTQLKPLRAGGGEGEWARVREDAPAWQPRVPAVEVRRSRRPGGPPQA